MSGACILRKKHNVRRFGVPLQVWDSNALQAACTFSLPVQVSNVAMSACAAGHCLVAVAAQDPEVRLCDPRSGSFSHTLLGHRNKVWTVCWSLQSEWELLSGGCDGQVQQPLIKISFTEDKSQSTLCHDYAEGAVWVKTSVKIAAIRERCISLKYTYWVICRFGCGT